MNNILVTGSNGQLALEIKNISKAYIDFKFLFCNRKELDITNIKTLEVLILNNKINTIINCAAYTDVDKAEDNLEKAEEINYQGVEVLAKVSKNNNIKLIHVSTDYVFNGEKTKPYTEDDITNPLGVYGRTKRKGELILQKINPPNCIIIRTSWLYSVMKKNFVTTMLELGRKEKNISVVYDQIGTPTNAKDLAKIILQILPEIKNEEVAIFNYSNEGFCSWFDFAQAIFDIERINCNVKPILSSEYQTKVKRPKYSVLDKSKIKKTYGVSIPYWRDSLKEYLNKI